jgi:hypothetical protein
MTDTTESIELDPGVSSHWAGAEPAEQRIDPESDAPSRETVVDSGQVFYDVDNPYDVELRLSLDGGQGVGVMSLGPMDMAALAAQLEEVRIAQRKMQHVIDHGDADDFVDDVVDQFGADDGSAFDQSKPDSQDEKYANTQPQPRRKVEKATDPYAIRDALEKIPPIGKYSGKTVLTVAVLVLLVLSGLLAIAL